METYGDGKLIPPGEVLVDELMAETEKRLRAEITARILSEVDWMGGSLRPWRRSPCLTATTSPAASLRCSRTSQRPTGAPTLRRSSTT